MSSIREHRERRRLENLKLTASAKESSPCAQCGADSGSPCVTPSGRELLSRVDAPGVHKCRIKAVSRPVIEYAAIADLMALYGVSRSTIHRRTQDGTLTAYRMGPRTIRYDLAEVEAALRG